MPNFVYLLSSGFQNPPVGGKGRSPISANGIVLDKFGSYETYYYESDNNKSAPKITNVIGIAEKKVEKK